ncbi:MAG: primosomal protein N', partial [Planctomycetota bacterium]
MKTRKYASLVYPIPVNQKFIYAVPPIFRGEIGLGARVKAPFRNRIKIGFVVDLLDKVEEGNYNILEIKEVVDSEPLITPQILELTQWIAEY